MSSVPTYPSQPLRIMTAPLRAQTEPRSGGFLGSIMRHHDFDALDEGIIMLNEPERKPTQEEQDAADEKARKRAMRNLVDSWQERLQLISVITTFFASTEAALLVNTKPVDSRDTSDPVSMATNACLLGSLILHVYAAVLSFLGAFLLIRYKLKEATRDEMIAEGMKLVNSPSVRSAVHDVERGAADPGRTLTSFDIPLRRKSAENGTAKLVSAPTKHSSFSLEPPVISAHPHLEQVGPFMSSVSSHLLSRTHALCVCLAAAGFVLAIAGILCYAWDSQPHAVSIFATASFGVAALAMGILLL